MKPIRPDSYPENTVNLERLRKPDSDAREVPDCLRRLTPEELAKVPRLTKQELDAALEQGERDRDAMEAQHVRCGGSVPFDQWPVYITRSLAQRILAALEQEAHAGDVSVARLEALADELRAVIGK